MSSKGDEDIDPT